ncbi:hypothetical protein M413DRAFT_26408 [Hebeloma cylindrosporum]|uniref:Uncharacterized protein n=1 Tax=Hebeloma cylindrosporum TaxID=76867 RepID=A0A0C3CGG1_HEBCY|nr:hypothetical protein M413DRAFT_26408 [Hebeloma cylindrosporum h7]
MSFGAADPIGAYYAARFSAIYVLPMSMPRRMMMGIIIIDFWLISPGYPQGSLLRLSRKSNELPYGPLNGISSVHDLSINQSASKKVFTRWAKASSLSVWFSLAVNNVSLCPSTEQFDSSINSRD